MSLIANEVSADKGVVLDLDELTIREVNRILQSAENTQSRPSFRVIHPAGEHAIACGLMRPIEVTIAGHAGYYTAGMNQEAEVSVVGNVSTGVAENMMSGRVTVRGNAGASAGATAHGGLLVIHGDAGSRCGIALKGADVVVAGSVGHMAGFMAQLGRIVICGDADEALGDSLYEAEIFVGGKVAELGADCEPKPMEATHVSEITRLLSKAGVEADAASFKRYGSARGLYNFNTDRAGSYG